MAEFLDSGIEGGRKEADIPSTLSSLRATVIQTAFHIEPNASRNPCPPRKNIKLKKAPKLKFSS